MGTAVEPPTPAPTLNHNLLDLEIITIVVLALLSVCVGLLLVNYTIKIQVQGPHDTKKRGGAGGIRTRTESFDMHGHGGHGYDHGHGHATEESRLLRVDDHAADEQLMGARSGLSRTSSMNQWDVDDPRACLTDSEVVASRNRYGPNEIVIVEEPWIIALAKCFMEPMSIMLEISMLISGAAEEWADFAMITTMLLVNSLLGFFEDIKAKAAVSALKAKMVNHVDTLRYGEDGRKTYIPLDPKELVVGDTIHVRGGDAIPADCLFLEGAEIAINTAAMTGESLPVKFNANGPMISDPKDPTGERQIHKLILGGCVVHQSPGTHLKVAKVGKDTVSGEASLLIAEHTGKSLSAFEEKIMNVVMYLIVVTLLDVVVVIIVQVFVRHHNFWQEIVRCLSLIIASVPVALPMVIQITMALGAASMAEHKAIVTSFPALQDIAAMTVLCSDKTGTLTTANMTVDFNDIQTWNGFTKEQVMDFAAVSCGESTEDPIDRAVRMSYNLSISVPEKALAMWKVNKVEGFTPDNKRVTAYAKHPLHGERKLSKGLLDKILNTGNDSGESNWVIDNLDRLEPEIREADLQFSRKGYKTVGVACGEMDSEGNYVMKFAGIIPMIDPPRHDTADVIKKLNHNGISVRMVTGDHKNIAIETAKRIGLSPNILANTALKYLEDDLNSDTSSQREAKDDTQPSWCIVCDVDEVAQGPVMTSETTDLILNAGGFAQVFPTDKLMIVKTFRTANGGAVTGMTGDGVNDAPALKAANVGIAVKGSTAAAQQAADIILTDDGLMPIHTAVAESRKIYARLKSYVLYRISATIQIVLVLSVLIFAYDATIPALYVILLALLNDITMITISYDNARVTKEPVQPSISGIVATAGVVGLCMATSSIVFFILAYNGYIMSDNFSTIMAKPAGMSGSAFGMLEAAHSTYQSSVMYVQISVGIEMMIFNCREPADWFWSSAPCLSLLGSVIFANLLVIVLAGTGVIISQVTWGDLGVVCLYDVCIFILTDIIKVYVGGPLLANTIKPGTGDAGGAGAQGAAEGGGPAPSQGQPESHQHDVRGVWTSFAKWAACGMGM